MDLFYLAIVQLIITWIMTGIMWFSQIIHYPLYMKIREGFIEYERSYIRRSAILLGPLILIEALTAIILIGMAKEGILIKLAGVNLILLILIWLSTFLFQTTQHQKLSIRFSKKILQGLIHFNWVRTILWTAKGVVMFFFLKSLFF